MKVTIEAPELVDVIKELVGELKKEGTSSLVEAEKQASPVEDKTETFSISLDDDIRPLLGQAVADGKKEQVKALLAEFGINKVSELPADKLEEFYKQASNKL
ncbi:hypothetical protein NSQ26_13825 [Bacillus sp. FSL W7-1360]